MKICAVGLRGIPGIMGGIETHCQNLYPFMADDFDIVVIARSPYVKAATVYRNVRVVPVWTLKNKYLETILHSFLAVLYARFSVRCDVIHLHAIGPALFAPLARLLGMKVVVTHHGADYDRDKWNTLARMILRLGEWNAVTFAHCVLVVGKTLAKQLQDKFPRKAGHIFYVPNGAVLPDLSQATAALLRQIDPRLLPGNYVLSVGRLVPEKGVHDLIAAHKQSGTERLLVVVGDADHEDAYSRQLKDQQSDTVLFLGRRQGAELATLFRYATLFVLPSYHEGLPIVALEAISADVPVLLSDIVPNKDLGLSNEHYYRVKGVDDLADKLMISDSIPAISGDFLKQYQWSVIADITGGILREKLCA